MYGSGTIPLLTAVDIMQLLTATIFYSKCLDTGTILQLLLKTMVIPIALWTTFKKILHKSSTIILPGHVSPKDLANSFVHFFSDKIMKIRTTLQSSAPVSITRLSINNSALSSFEPVSEDDILKILKSSPTKSCDLDPIPTSLVKECTDILNTQITNIISYSLKEGSFPNFFKITYVTPLLKKPSLDRNLLKNYQPV